MAILPQYVQLIIYMSLLSQVGGLRIGLVFDWDKLLGLTINAIGDTSAPNWFMTRGGGSSQKVERPN